MPVAVITPKRETTGVPSAPAVMGRQVPWRAVLVPLVVVLALLSTVFFVEWAYADRAVPGLSVAGVEAGSLTGPELRARFGDRAGASVVRGGDHRIVRWGDLANDER